VIKLSLIYRNLDPKTREFMKSELESDISGERVYISSRLTESGIQLWSNLLAEAMLLYDDAWLATQLQAKGCLNGYEPNPRTGGVKRVPYNASVTLAEGEFNRYYARGICLRAVSEGISEVEVYRGKEVSHPRIESEMKIGTLVSAIELLKDLRNSVGVETALGIPPGPNSGITVCLPTK